MKAANRIMERADELAAISESDTLLCRRYLTSEHQAANAVMSAWMEAAGMHTRIDAVGNLIGRYEGLKPGARTILIGSHLDTVRNAGKYDGPLGVLAGIECVARLNKAGQRLSAPIEVIGFCDEEGTRFATTLIGSHAIAGTFDPSWLTRCDEHGISMAEALTTFGLNPSEISRAKMTTAEIDCFVEVHIEQGPVLESEDLALGIVTAISGASRFQVTVRGTAGHAGTVPMGKRADALAAAAEMILAVESVANEFAVVATVGAIEARPGAVNVIAGTATFSLDLRAERDESRRIALSTLFERLDNLARNRGVVVSFEPTHEADACRCDPALMQELAQALERRGLPAKNLPSGAGHDAMAMATLAPVAMLFVRCKGGISHHPAESITGEDAELACDVLYDFLLNHESTN